MSLTATDLARVYGMRVEDVNAALTGSEDATSLARRLGISPEVASALVAGRKARKKK